MPHFYERISFIVGLTLGVLLAFHFRPSVINEQINKPSSSYKTWFLKQNLTRKQLTWDTLRYTNKTFITESDYLRRTIKILCIILVKSPSNFEAASATWARACHKIIPIYLQTNPKQMPRMVDKRMSSWILLCKLLLRIDLNIFDWILVVRDTSFVIMENLRYFVAPLDKGEKYYLGHAIKFWSTIYNSGEPGYVVSSGAVKEFNKFMSEGRCEENHYWNKEDYYLGQYLAKLNVTPTSAYDDKGLTTFYPYSWYHVFFPGENYYQGSMYSVNCCSKRSIAFEAIEGDKMYFYNYILYNLQVFTDGKHGNLPYKDNVPVEMVWKSFVKSQNVSFDENVSGEQYYKLWENLINDPNSFAKNIKKEQLFDYD